MAPARRRLSLPSPRRLASAAGGGLGALALFLSGCGGVMSSLRTETTVLVKVPATEIRPAADAQGWHFRHVLEAPRDPARRGQWYVAWHNERPIRTAPWTPYWRTLLARTPEIADATYAALGCYPALIEPNRTFGSAAAKQPPEPGEQRPDSAAPGASARLVLRKVPSPAWADGRRPDPLDPRKFILDPAWHLGDRYSELGRARERVGVPSSEKQRIRIGHLDNGLDGRHVAAPAHLVRGDWKANAVELRRYAQALSQRGESAAPVTPHPPAPEETGASHGMGTIGILTGGRVRIDEKAVSGGRIARFDGYLGGAPHAVVVPVRVAPWVFSISTAELAYAIDYASRVQRCDVITLSHGGAPTQAWVDAVNAAYERGTAMFAAESDFFSLAFDPIPPRGLLLPASPVYPAAFRRVLGVTGVTADRRSYGQNTLGRLLRSPQAFLQWAMRGSYGADGTSTVLYRPKEDPDPSQVKRNGSLRPQPIAAYSPNIPWLAVRTAKTADGHGSRRIADAVDLDGAGTSAATPQVAAAAALWLQYHRREFSAREWASWRKTEAVYFALLASAERAPDRAWPDRYLGAGVLKANRALNVTYADARRARRPRGVRTPPRGSLYYEQVGRDYFDAERSLLSLLGLQSWKKVDVYQRAALDQQPKPGETRAGALERLYYNEFLLRKWHGGEIPSIGAEQTAIKLRAADRAAHAPLPTDGAPTERRSGRPRSSSQ